MKVLTAITILLVNLLYVAYFNFRQMLTPSALVPLSSPNSSKILETTASLTALDALLILQPIESRLTNREREDSKLPGTLTVLSKLITIG